MNVPCGVFEYHRIEHAAQKMPAADERAIDIAVLDMNHGWPNLGHDSMVHLIQDATCDVLEVLKENGLRLRAISFDVRRTGIIPEDPGGRLAVYLGTGGPGHLDPSCNDGQSEGSQGIRENPAWEKPLFRLFDAIRADHDAVLLAVCHTFGVMCRWTGIGEPRLRGPEQGGKSTGLLENLLTTEAHSHPWFGGLSEKLNHDRIRIMDNRLYDIIPSGPQRNGFLVLSHDTLGVGGPRGDALTMVEWERDRGGVMPRIFGVNHHPEIVDRSRQLMILNRKHDRGEVSEKWYEERLDILTRTYPDENSEQLLALTSDYTIVGPLRFHLYRQIRLRAQTLGCSVPFHEDEQLRSSMTKI
ncbi:MAG TPA: hypothetical protein VLR94_05045 [Acidobacteriota bacterium]|nr:hypothetical protein [Acidobacteriota bacterium]